MRRRDYLLAKEMAALMESTQHPLDAIAGNKVLSEVSEQSRPSDPSHCQVHDHPDNAGRDSCLPNKSVRTTPEIPRALNLSGLKSPAIVLDNSMRVIWQNKMAIDQIWHRSPKANNGNPTPDIFDLLFDHQFQHDVDNWRQWVTFFIQQIIGFIPAEVLQDRIDQIDHRRRDVISTIVDREKAEYGNNGTFDGYLRQLLTDGGIRSFNVMTIEFNEGRLMVFVPIADSDGPATNRNSHDIRRRYNNVRRHPNPIKVGFSVLSAHLNNSISLKTELLSDEYCRLVNDLCMMCIDTVEQFGGCFFKHSDSGISAYFLPVDEHDEDTAMCAIRCALALKASMFDLSRKWKLRKSWLHDIELNIGIHYDYEYLGIVTSALGNSLASFGNALSTATGLARRSHNGQIWATKALFNSMLASVRCRLRFGIHRLDSHRRQVLIQHSFAKLRDLPGSGELSAEFCKELEDVAVTQIFDLQDTS
jgi:class 3 adenylate cyclase